MIINGEAFGPAFDGDDVIIRHIDDLTIGVSPGRVRIEESVTGRDLASFEVVQVAAYPPPTASIVGAIAEYLDDHQVPSINAHVAGVTTKVVQYVRLAQAGLRVPGTIYCARSAMEQSYPFLEQQLDLPFILKGNSSNGGRNNFLIRNGDVLRESLSRPTRSGLLAQQFIPNDTTHRVLVLGGEAAVTIRRTWAAGTHLTNSEQGGECRLLCPDDFDSEARRLAVHAAAVVGSEVAGVNLIQHWTTGEWYVLDVNANPAIAGGAFADEKLVAYRTYLCARLRHHGRGTEAQSR